MKKLFLLLVSVFTMQVAMADNDKPVTFEQLPQAVIYPASAQEKFNLENIFDAIIEHLPVSPPWYDKDVFTDKNLRFFASEIIREKTISSLSDEMPHVIYVEVEDMEYDENSREVWIRAVINVEREGQKGMIVGKGGSNIRRIRKESFTEIRRIFPGSRLNLDLRVKADPKWRKSGKVLSRIFR